MKIVQGRNDGQLVPRWEINDGVVVIDTTPLRKRATATTELLSNDMTATRYYAGSKAVLFKDTFGKTVLDAKTSQLKTKMVVGKDSLGKPIVLGKAFDYLDWKNPKRVFQVYVLRKVNGVKRLMPEGNPYDSADAAMTAATTLAESMSGGGTS